MIHQVDTGHGKSDNVCTIPEAWKNKDNAHLIAAAPDLLACVIELRDVVTGGGHSRSQVDAALDNADVAIAKAVGLADEKETS
jgi:hypothetical protein